MVFSVPPTKWDSFRALAESEGVEAFVLGVFENTGMLRLTYNGHQVGELSMEFLHRGMPNVVRVAKAPESTFEPYSGGSSLKLGEALHRILGSLNVCSKEWIIRQYDHEVQGGSVVKPLVGVNDDGPSDASVVCPILGSFQGISIACGMNPRYGDLDPYRMALSAIDEAMRNVVAVGGDPDRTALLDNFSVGKDRAPEILGSLCQAAFGCRDAALAYKTPFISGKDSLNNEYVTENERIVIPPSLLIAQFRLFPMFAKSVTMDLKQAGNGLILVGITQNEMGGSHFGLVGGGTGGEPPTINIEIGRRILRAIDQAIAEELLRSCHDLSEEAWAWP